MHLLRCLLPCLLASPALAAPEPKPLAALIEERHIVELTKRQSNVGQLLQLASLAGITALPTDNPALLLSLGPLASNLAKQLPTSSVLSVLITAAPSGFLSSIVNDPSYASSFASDFSAGSSPDWFNALPTDVRSYLHTYSGFTGVAGAAQAAKTGVSALSEGASGESSRTTSTMSGDGSSSSSVTSASGADTQTTSEAGQQAGGVGTEPSSSSSDGGASRPTGVLAAGVLGAVGVLGVVAL